MGTRTTPSRPSSPCRVDDPADAQARCQALTAARASEGMDDLAIAFARAKNLGLPELGSAYDRALMGDAEIALADAVEGEEGPLARGGRVTLTTTRRSRLLADLRVLIDTFFDAVLVMDPDAGGAREPPAPAQPLRHPVRRRRGLLEARRGSAPR